MRHVSKNNDEEKNAKKEEEKFKIIRKAAGIFDADRRILLKY